jgi:truncated hemoglobin YjbI
MFEWAGGFPALTLMTTLFYEKYVPQDPLLAPQFANMQADHPQRVAAWLGEVFGGPAVYDEKYGGYEHMLSQHLGKSLTEAQRARWVALLTQAADEAGIPSDAEFRSAFAAYLEWGSRLAVENSTPGAHPPEQMPVPKWGWGVAGPPTGRISALAPEVEEAVDLPRPGEPVSFEQHIKPLFRTEDRDAMSWAFDLASYEDVSRHAASILDRIQDGTMPCDITWPEEKLEVFKRWVDSGKAK